MSTSLQTRALVGRQAPRILHRPPWASEAAADEAIGLAESVGLILDPWQEIVVRVCLAERSDGRWAAPEVGFLVARQNGKGGALEAVVLHGMFLVGDPLTLWTAHQFKTSTEAFLRIRGWIDGSDDLRRLVSKVNAAHGEEGIELRSGARLRFVARSKSSGRGFSPQRIVFDEAQELSSLAVDAMLPSMSAQANPQAIYTGTVPSPENNAEHWASVRDRGRAGKSARLAWAEWTPKGSDDPAGAKLLDLDDRAAWAYANPASGVRPGVLTEEYIAGEREAMAPESFAQERLSVWPAAGVSSGVIDPAAWASRAGDRQDVESPVVLAVETTLDRSVTVVVAVGARSDGVPQVEVARQSSGTAWVPTELVGICQRNPDVEAVVVDDRAQAKSLITAIRDAFDDAHLDVELVVTSTSDMAEACGQVMDAITEGPLVHLSDPLLDAAVAGAVKRSIGDGAWAWSRRSGGPTAAPLIGMTLALWAWRARVRPYDPLSNIF